MPISATLPSEVRLIPARAGLNAVFALRKRNLQTGTAIYKIIFKRNFMLRNFLVIFSCVFFVINLACQSASQPNGNSSTEQSNLPEGISTKPLANGERPAGIPETANINTNVSPGATPTPGIPDPKTIGKTPMPKGTPPIPGIPDEETLKKQMNQMKGNSNSAKPPQNGSNSTNNQNAQPRRVGKGNNQFE